MVKSLELNKWFFWLILLVFCFVIFYLSIKDAGLGGLIYFYFFGTLYLIILGITLIINIITSILKKEIKPKISLLSLIILLLTYAAFFFPILTPSDLPVSDIQLFYFHYISHSIIFLTFIIQAYYRGSRKISQ
jgi:hypothetical protein